MSNSSKLDQIMRDHVDNLYYINDIFAQDIPKINHGLADLLLRHVILPVLVGSLGSEKHQQHHLDIPLSAFFIAQILKIIKHPPLINSLAACLFLREVRQELLTVVLGVLPMQVSIIPNESDDILLEDLEYLDESENLKHNTIRDVVFSFLRSRDDNLVTLTLLMIQGVM